MQLIPREIVIQLWYPAIATSKEKHWYINPRSLDIIKSDLRTHFKTPLEQLSFLDKVSTHSVLDSKISEQQTTYPVIIFSAGFGAPTNFYTSFLEELASHGYIVVALSYAYITSGVVFPDGKVVIPVNSKTLQELWQLKSEDEVTVKEEGIWVADISFIVSKLKKLNALDPHAIFTNKIDLSKLGLFGHSFGGGVSLSACRSLSECKAVAVLDGRERGARAGQGFNTPALFV